jgi:hypothetical protein
VLVRLSVLFTETKLLSRKLIPSPPFTVDLASEMALPINPLTEKLFAS